LWQIIAGDKTADEEEAYGAERKLAQMRLKGDINLPAERKGR